MIKLWHHSPLGPNNNKNQTTSCTANLADELML